MRNTKVAVVAGMITSVLLLAGVTATWSHGNLQYYRIIVSSGTIEQHPLTEKSVTWRDGSTETVMIDSSGRVFLNGTRTVAFGLNIMTIPFTDYGSNAIDQMFTTCENGGIRFMALDVGSWLDVSDALSYIDFWMPQLYSHKMWVALYIQHNPEPPDLNVTEQLARISGIVDGVTNQTWAKMIFAVGYSWEIDQFGFTDCQIETFLSAMYPLAQETVNSSMIGLVPVVAKYTNNALVIQYSDIPNCDSYYSLKNQNGWQADFDTQSVHQQMSKVGKSRLNIWLSEAGAYSNDTNAQNYPYTPAMFQYQYTDAGYNDTSAIFLWVLQWDSPYAYSAFDMNGNPYPWFANVLSYYSSL